MVSLILYRVDVEVEAILMGLFQWVVPHVPLPPLLLNILFALELNGEENHSCVKLLPALNGNSHFIITLFTVIAWRCNTALRESEECH
jgi:hypothetical protein